MRNTRPGFPVVNEVHATCNGQERVDIAAQGIASRPRGGFIFEPEFSIASRFLWRGAEDCKLLLEDVNSSHRQEGAGAAGAIHDAFAWLGIEHLHGHFSHIERSGITAFAAIHDAASNCPESAGSEAGHWVSLRA